MANKYYAVKKGRTPGIYMTWDECKSQVDGFPSAEYKSFKSETDAQQYMGTDFVNSISVSVKKNVSEPLSISCIKDTLIAYVDGSYDDVTKRFSYGAVLFYNNNEVHLSECVNDESLVSMRNVAGEIKGAEAAMRYAVDNNIKNLVIYHDYEGISKWCTGEWKANKDGTIAYRLYYSSITSKINIRFVKVKGHSNDKYNDMADKLAKGALGLE